MKTVLIIDDHPAYRAGVKAIIESGNNEYQITGEAGTAEEGFALACKLKPDIAIVDLRLPDKHGIPLTRQITDIKIPVMIVTAHSETAFVLRTIQAGATGYVVKDSESETILNCLKTVSEGKQFIDPALNLDFDKTANKHNDKYKTLTEREQDVMRLLSENFSEKETADKLNISLNTVKSHRANIYEKLGVKDRVELIQYAVKIGLVDTNGW